MKRLALFLAGVALCSCCLAETVFVDLRAEAEVDKLPLSLGDLARLDARDKELARQLGGLQVDVCPTLAKSCRVDREKLAQAIAGPASRLGASLAWSATEAILVKGHVRPVSLSAAVDQGGVQILDRLGRGEILAAVVRDESPVVQVPPGAREIRPDLGGMRRIGGNVDLPFNVLVDGIPVARPVVRYALVHGVKPVGSGESKVTRSGLPLKPVGEVQAAGGALPVQAVPAAAVVGKNRPVRLLIDSGAVRIEADGLAVGDAGLGEYVGVVRQSAGGEIRGRVIGQGLVLLEEN